MHPLHTADGSLSKQDKSLLGMSHEVCVTAVEIGASKTQSACSNHLAFLLALCGRIEDQGVAELGS